ncbi:DUF2264 domain-containing protein [Clostridium sp. Marseille-P2415]|uniref:DUF2264 domain-containing protein n=1 Tax=Clostridium sp. Marseille-P2415 TaxID=1805471 RepID=UPI0009887640|nr:DUF2264 domain-containing protein [Clostridium sp. Marseille-P2415]
MDDRKYWLKIMLQIAAPVLEAAAEGRLHKDMPCECRVEEKSEVDIRRKFTHLEAIGRTLDGISAWLACEGLTGEEEALRLKYVEITRKAIINTTDPQSPDFVNFKEGRQPLVDAAFFAHGLIRAKSVLLDPLTDRQKQNIADCMAESTKIKSGFNNFYMFLAMIETLLYVMGKPYDMNHLDSALHFHEIWYKGDGMYGDGEEYCMNYYNSFVIQPMYYDVARIMAPADKDWSILCDCVVPRAKRYAGILERLISPEGTFPAVGRSLAYRFGAMQHLSQMALCHNLPEEVTPMQVRCALTAVIKNMMRPGTFDENGWLKIGWCGAQREIGEVYISTGSLYLCTTVFLPLGLSPSDPFWSGPDTEWTNKRQWGGGLCMIDEARHEKVHQTIYDHDAHVAKGGH